MNNTSIADELLSEDIEDNEDIIEDIEDRLNIESNEDDDLIKYEKNVSILKKSYTEIKSMLSKTIEDISDDLSTIHENSTKPEIIKNIDPITKLTELKMKHIITLSEINKKEFELSVKGLNLNKNSKSTNSEEKGMTTKELKNFLRKAKDNDQSTDKLF